MRTVTKQISVSLLALAALLAISGPCAGQEDLEQKGGGGTFFGINPNPETATENPTVSALPRAPLQFIKLPPRKINGMGIIQQSESKLADRVPGTTKVRFAFAALDDRFVVLDSPNGASKPQVKIAYAKNTAPATESNCTVLAKLTLKADGMYWVWSRNSPSKFRTAFKQMDQKLKTAMFEQCRNNAVLARYQMEPEMVVVSVADNKIARVKLECSWDAVADARISVQGQGWTSGEISDEGKATITSPSGAKLAVTKRNKGGGTELAIEWVKDSSPSKIKSQRTKAEEDFVGAKAYLKETVKSHTKATNKEAGEEARHQKKTKEIAEAIKIINTDLSAATKKQTNIRKQLNLPKLEEKRKELDAALPRKTVEGRNGQKRKVIDWDKANKEHKKTVEDYHEVERFIDAARSNETLKKANSIVAGIQQRKNKKNSELVASVKKLKNSHESAQSARDIMNAAKRDMEGKVSEVNRLAKQLEEMAALDIVIEIQSVLSGAVLARVGLTSATR